MFANYQLFSHFLITKFHDCETQEYHLKFRANAIALLSIGDKTHMYVNITIFCC